MDEDFGFEVSLASDVTMSKTKSPFRNVKTLADYIMSALRTLGSEVLITGSRKGIGRFLAENYLARGYTVIGCSRGETDLHHEQYFHYKCDVAAERDVTKLIRKIRKNTVVLMCWSTMRA